MANIVDEVIQLVDTTSSGFVEAVYSGLVSANLPFIRTMLIISMILFGISMMAGWIETPLKELTKTVFKIATVLGLLFNWPIFQTILFNTFTNGPDALGGIILSSITADTSDHISSRLGELFETGIAAAGAAFSSDGWFLPIVLGVVIFIGIGVIVGYMLALIILAKIATTMILALAPIFIFFLLFNGTRQMFNSWLQQLFNFAFMIILVYIVMAFFIDMIDKALEPIVLAGGDISFDKVAPIAIIGFVATFVMAQIPGIASGLAGGAQVSTVGAVSSLARQARGLSAARITGGAGGRVAGSLISKGFSRLTSRNNTLGRG